MNLPCPKAVQCECTEDPFANLSAERADSRRYFAIWDTPLPPDLGFTPGPDYDGKTWYEDGGTWNTQDGAWRNGWSKTRSRPGYTYGIGNTEQTCCYTCPPPDIGLLCYTLPASSIFGRTQRDVDARAYSIACTRARLSRICFPHVPPYCCKDVPYLFDFDCASPKPPSDVSPWTFSITNGELPPGINLEPLGPASSHCLLIGTPTTAGNYVFTLRVTRNDPDGVTYAERVFELDVLEIDQATLAQGSIGTPYSQQLTVTGGSGVYKFTLLLGYLPDGLTLSESGLISGTPTTDETQAFTIMVEDIG